MPKKPKRPSKDKDLVIAPGGPRKRESVHAVKAGESVFVQQGYGSVVTRRPRGIATDKMRAADAPANFVLTPGGFRHRSLVHQLARNEALHFTETRAQLINLATNVRKDIPKGRARSGEVPGPRQRLDHIRVLEQRYGEFPDFVSLDVGRSAGTVDRLRANNLPLQRHPELRNQLRHSSARSAMGPIGCGRGILLVDRELVCDLWRRCVSYDTHSSR